MSKDYQTKAKALVAHITKMKKEFDQYLINSGLDEKVRKKFWKNVEEKMKLKIPK